MPPASIRTGACRITVPTVLLAVLAAGLSLFDNNISTTTTTPNDIISIRTSTLPPFLVQGKKISSVRAESQYCNRTTRRNRHGSLQTL